MLKTNRFVQMTSNAKGIRAAFWRKRGIASVVKGVPDKEANVAKSVVGTANVPKSLAVKR